MDHSKRIQLYNSLLNDDAFLRWLLHPTGELDDYWNQIMQESPEKKEAINELKTIIKGMKIVEEDCLRKSKKRYGIKLKRPPTGKEKHSVCRPSFAMPLFSASHWATGAYFYMARTHVSDTSIDYQSLASDTSAINGTSGNVLIVLANQEKIEMQETNMELVHDAEGHISVNSKVIENDKSADKPEDNLNQLFVPYGKTTGIVMSDGSRVWVNSGSHVIYPSVFTAGKREIYVEGEVYLEVARDEKSPFIVKTDLLDIHVLGTSFNVSAYKNDKNQSVVLATGSVSIKGNHEKTVKTIKPNQKYTFEKNTNHSGIQEVDIFDYISWKYGFLSFKKEKLSDVLKKIERYYNVRIDYNASEIDRTSVSGKLDLKGDIQETFRIISITAPIEYNIQEKEIKINVKP
jgi:hypothetical protein